MPNTLISLTYRNANLDKDFAEVVVKGAITDEQLAQIGNTLDVEHQFIAHQVGLPTPSGFGAGYFPREGLDHSYTIFDAIHEDFSAADMHTERNPTINMDIDELVARFVANDGDWDCEGEWDRYFG